MLQASISNPRMMHSYERAEVQKHRGRVLWKIYGCKRRQSEITTLCNSIQETQSWFLMRSERRYGLRIHFGMVLRNSAASSDQVKSTLQLAASGKHICSHIRALLRSFPFDAHPSLYHNRPHTRYPFKTRNCMRNPHAEAIMQGLDSCLRYSISNAHPSAWTR